MRATLIFDLDGTLIDSCAICVDILSEMLIERGATQRIDPIAARPWMSHGGFAALFSAVVGGWALCLNIMWGAATLDYLARMRVVFRPCAGGIPSGRLILKS